MAGKAATEELDLTEVGGGRGGFDAPSGRGDGDGGGAPGRAGMPQGIYVTGIWLALASIVMFFTALTSSFIVRKGLSNDWVAFPLPRILWANTAVLLASSATLERARRLLRRQNSPGFRRWWGMTTGLGLLFLAGQLVAWRQLATAGVYVATNPSSSFFYLLTGAHGVHLLGGLLALYYAGFRGLERARRQTAANATGIYWHFMGGLWVILFLLLSTG